MNERESNFSPGGGGGNPPAEHLDSDVCVDLLHGLLDPARERELLAHLVTCPTCESLLQACVASRERLRATRSVQRLPSGEMVLVDAAAVEGSTSAARSAGQAGSLGSVLAGLARRPQGVWRAVAGGLAAAAVLLVVYLLALRPAPGPLPVTPLPVSFDAPVLLADLPGAEVDQLQDGLTAYAAGDYRRASECLEQKAGGGQIETYRLVYLGSALAFRGRYRESASVLRALPRRTIPNPWGSHVAWTLHEALRRSGQEESADSLLHVLAAGLGPDGDRARAMLDLPARE